MNIGTNIAQIFQHAVLFLINNSMSLRINVVFFIYDLQRDKAL